MTYALAEPLQTAVYGALSGDVALSSLVGNDIYDAPLPLDNVAAPNNYVLIGTEQVTERASKDVDAAIHDLSITVHSNDDGFLSSKKIAGAICDVLLDAQLPLARGRLVCLRFLKARADAGKPPARRTITLKFRAFVEDSSS